MKKFFFKKKNCFFFENKTKRINNIYIIFFLKKKREQSIGVILQFYSYAIEYRKQKASAEEKKRRVGAKKEV